jgi:hypothetical protein
MDEAAIIRYIVEAFAGVETVEAEGVTFFFFGPERRMPFATLATRDDPYDRASRLDRPGVFRLNLGVGRETYRALFGPPPAPGPDGVADPGRADHDFTALDRLLPHPVYAPQHWVCVLNLGAATFEAVRPLLAEAYARAARRRPRG